MSEAVAELRNLSTTNRVSLYVNYFFTTASPETSQALFNTLNANIRRCAGELSLAGLAKRAGFFRRVRCFQLV